MKRSASMVALRENLSAPSLSREVILENGKRVILENGKRVLRKTGIEKFIKQEKFSEKVSFEVGVCMVFVTEFVLLRYPQWMGLFYTAELVPLMVIRYLTYHRDKHHYFMLDFCYFTQILLMLYLYWTPFQTPSYFAALFATCNGPVAAAIFMWSNSLVFHSLDKITSTTIHFMPALITYCVRWHSSGGIAGVCFDEHCAPSITSFLVPGLIAYTFWQAMYLLKTEVLDRPVLERDAALVTSLRWMTTHRPHPIYKMVKERQWPIPGIVLLVGVQYFYTAAALMITPFFFRYRWLHTAWLLYLFFHSIWAGAGFYFNVLGNEKKRVALEERAKAKKMPLKDTLRVSSSRERFVSFMVFFGAASASLVILIRSVLMETWT